MTFLTTLIITACASLPSGETQCVETEMARWESADRIEIYRDMADCLELGDELYGEYAWECRNDEFMKTYNHTYGSLR